MTKVTSIRPYILMKVFDISAVIDNHATVKVNGTQDDTNAVYNYVLQKPVKKVARGKDDINGKTVNSGDELTYYITVKNSKAEKVSMTVTDTLNGALQFVSATDGGAASGQTVTWNLSLDANAEKTVAVIVKGDASKMTGDTEVPNTATIKLDDLELTSNEVKVTIHKLETPNPSITQKAGNAANGVITTYTTSQGTISRGTGDGSHMLVWGMGIGAAAILLIFLKKRKMA